MRGSEDASPVADRPQLRQVTKADRSVDKAGRKKYRPDTQPLDR